ncbi:hypothetical protein G3N95_20165 [Paraburkholderia sp. Tr-20389]|uniref:hypothetical protein n=1 Tax=Paraburkholderia sp. Tr-20389 TaxID=2703903 RepID=UPI00197EE38D|nr:hypothetical protein [Paraburkholderia sp. Tr-20389]MBN3755271.1 hypothetical protein [Paraburkholderia sp. Tr-20389]
MQREHSIDTRGQASSSRDRRAEHILKAGETARNWPWADVGRHYDWMDCHLPFEEGLTLNEI